MLGEREGERLEESMGMGYEITKILGVIWNNIFLY